MYIYIYKLTFIYAYTHLHIYQHINIHSYIYTAKKNVVFHEGFLQDLATFTEGNLKETLHFLCSDIYIYAHT